MHPKTPRALSGTPQSITAERTENGGKLAGKSASTKQPMAMANINKQHCLLAGSCAVVLSVFSRSSVGKIGEGKEKIKRQPILRKVLFREKAPEYHSGVIDKECICESRCCERRAQYGLGRRNMLKHANEESGLRNFFPTRKRTLKEKKYLKRNRRNVP